MLAVKHAAALAKPQDWLYLVTVYNKPVKEVKDIWQNADTLLTEAEEIINQFDTAPHFKSFIRVHPEPNEEILEFAAKNNCDYIVMGTRGLTGLKSMFLGSTSDYVVRNAEIPVLIARDDTDREARKGRRGSFSRSSKEYGRNIPPVDTTSRGSKDEKLP